jgi:hypothetical protein
LRDSPHQEQVGDATGQSGHEDQESKEERSRERVNDDYVNTFCIVRQIEEEEEQNPEKDRRCQQEKIGGEPSGSIRSAHL